MIDINSILMSLIIGLGTIALFFFKHWFKKCCQQK